MGGRRSPEGGGSGFGSLLTLLCSQQAGVPLAGSARHHQGGVDAWRDVSITTAVSRTRAPGDRMTEVEEEPAGL